MRITSKKIIAFCAPLLLVQPAVVAADDEAAIKYRQSVMKSVGGHMGAIASIVKGQVDYTDQLVPHARALRDLSDMVSKAFAQRTEGGDTQAKPEIWSMSADFDKRVKDLQNATAAFLGAAETGVAGAKEKMGAVGNACKGCHDNFREKKS